MTGSRVTEKAPVAERMKLLGRIAASYRPSVAAFLNAPRTTRSSEVTTTSEAPTPNIPNEAVASPRRSSRRIPRGASATAAGPNTTAGRAQMPMNRGTELPTAISSHSGPSSARTSTVDPTSSTWPSASVALAVPNRCSARSTAWKAFSGHPTAVTTPTATDAWRPACTSSSENPSSPTRMAPPAASTRPAPTPSTA